TAPGALVLSSSVPANAAAAVAVSSSIALTFTTPIEDYAYTLIKTGTGTAVACDASLDAGRKVLTIKPTVNLGAATAHILVISSVADVFGQSLKDQVINFTTA
ncbi:MAG: Ig-like domain-containing protein, partial [Oscillospiraceae bacterium]